MSKKIFALIDCNSFFASCERVFNPALKGKPVVVLSNNDGCAIARTDEAKKLGIKMGQPFFEFKHLAAQHKVEVFSSNFSLYGDMSRRVMETLQYFTDNIEIYSIDEAFLDLSEFKNSDLDEFGRAIKNTVQQWTGLPVSVGIGPTKTLAKAANELAKTHSEYSGVLSLSNKLNIDEYLSQLPVENIWGVGRQYAKMLKGAGVHTAAAFKRQPDTWVQSRMHAPGLHTLYELRGTPVLALDHAPEPKKSIVVSRSFRNPVTEYKNLKQAVSSYALRCAEKLREEGSVCQSVTVFIMTNRFHDHYYSNSAHIRLHTPTAYFPDIITAVHKGFKKIFKKGYGYKRAGVLATDISSSEKIQFDFFTDQPAYFRKQKLLKFLDSINLKHGSDTITSAGAMRNRLDFDGKKFKSRHFTTDWQSVLKVKA